MNEQIVIEKARAGDLSSLEELLEKYYAELTRYIETRVGDGLRNSGYTGADVVQETCFRAFRDIRSFRQSGSFAGWLKRIGDRCIFELARAQSRKKRGGDKCHVLFSQEQRDSYRELADIIAGSTETPSKQLVMKEAIQAVQIALAALSTEQQTAIRLRYFERLTLREVGRTMNRSESAVRGLIHRAINSMQASMRRSSARSSMNQGSLKS